MSDAESNRDAVPFAHGGSNRCVLGRQRLLPTRRTATQMADGRANDERCPRSAGAGAGRAAIAAAEPENQRCPRATREREVQRQSQDGNRGARGDRATLARRACATTPTARMSADRGREVRTRSSTRAARRAGTALNGSSYASNRSGKSRVPSPYDRDEGDAAQRPCDDAGTVATPEDERHRKGERDVYEHALDLAHGG